MGCYIKGEFPLLGVLLSGCLEPVIAFDIGMFVFTPSSKIDPVIPVKLSNVLLGLG